MECQASESAFLECDLRDGIFATSVFKKARLTGSNLENASLAECDFAEAHLDRARLVELWAPGGHFCHADFSASDLTEAMFLGCDLSGPVLLRAF